MKKGIIVAVIGILIFFYQGVSGGAGKGQERPSQKYEGNKSMMESGQMDKERERERYEEKERERYEKGMDDKEGDRDRERYEKEERERLEKEKGEGMGDIKGEEGRAKAREKATDKGQGEKKGRPWWKFWGNE